ncbi:MAG: hypothetical protein ACYSW6_09600, partial [Planctomycetota bacterium]
DRMATNNFENLMRQSYAPVKVKQVMEFVLTAKQLGAELDEGPADPVLHGYIQDKVDRYRDGFGIPVHGAPSWDRLNWLFLYTLEKADDL